MQKGVKDKENRNASMGPEICEFHQQPSKQNEGKSKSNSV